MKVPTNIMYAKTHEWVKFEGNLATIGITDHAQSELGDIVFINLPSVGQTVSIGKALTDVESVKAVSDILSYVSGKVVEVNDELESSPEMINNSPYDAWICKVEFTQKGQLLSAAEYSELIK